VLVISTTPPIFVLRDRAWCLLMASLALKIRHPFKRLRKRSLPLASPL
jgi:hypothetical protein